MVDLTKYVKDGIVIDENYIFRGANKSTNDLIHEMSRDGLVVNYLDTSGELVRVKVTSGDNHRPDKHGEKSGWYTFFTNGEYQNAVYGNWRTGLQKQWSNIDPNELSITQRNQIKADMSAAKEQAEAERKIRQNEVAELCQTRFGTYQELTAHPYLDAKGIKNEYGFREHKGTLVVPIYSTDGELRSLQYIDKKGRKRFVSSSEIKGNVFPIGFNLGALGELESVLVCEGVATGVSLHMATKQAVLVVFSASFGLEALTRLRKISKARLILAFDNDANGVGQKKATECSNSLHNTIIRLPSMQGDFNDLHLERGIEAVKLEIEGGGIGIKRYEIRSLVGEPPPVQFLVDRLIPLATPGVLAAVGGIGKSFLALQLAMNIANGSGKFLGKNILQSGNSVIFASEDSRLEIHRRIHALDPEGKRFDAPYDVYCVTIADMGKPMILLSEDNITSIATEIVEELKTIPDLKLLVFDPIQSFVAASSPISNSNESAQLWCTFCASIAAQLGCTVLSIHHMNKSALTGAESAMDARQSIRGASSIVDGMRFAFAMWLTDEKEANRVCLAQGIEPDPTAVVRAGMVKSNSGNIDNSIMTLIRKKNSPVLDILKESKEIKWD